MATTPMGKRLNDEYDTLRHVLGRMHPDKAEQARRELLAVLVLVRVELTLWVGVRKSALPIMPEGVVFEALSLDAGSVEVLLRELRGETKAVDLKDLLT